MDWLRIKIIEFLQGIPKEEVLPACQDAFKQGFDEAQKQINEKVIDLIDKLPKVAK